MKSNVMESLEGRVFLSTSLVKDIRTIPSDWGSDPHDLVEFNGKVIFSADDGAANGRELYITDGTTTRMIDTNPGPNWGAGKDEVIARSGSYVFFNGHDAKDYGVFRTDGTTAGTFKVANGSANKMVDVNGTLYFSQGTKLMKVSGRNMPVLVKDFFGGNGAGPVQLTKALGKLFFIASQPGTTNVAGNELWVADSASARLVRDIAPGAASGFAYVGLNPFVPHFTEVAGKLYFTADSDGDGHGRHSELWRTDGTKDGTARIQQFPSNADFSINPSPEHNWTALNGSLIFQTSVNGNNVLRRYDPATGSTTTLLDPTAGNQVSQLVTVGSHVYFDNLQPFGPDNTLWSTNGSISGTRRINLPGLNNNYYAHDVTDVDGRAVFATDHEMWTTDSTDAGTYRVIPNSGGASVYNPSHFLKSGDQLYFDAPSVSFGSVGEGLGELFRIPTRGTITGTIYNDANRSGHREAGEPALGGRQAYLDLNNNSAHEVNEPIASTNAAGTFRFTNLLAGAYKVREILAAGWSQSTPANNVSFNVTVKIGISDYSATFGSYLLGSTNGSISGNVFHDFNRNGARDTGDTGLAGWTVYLDKDNDGILDSNEARVLTDSSGNYIFNNLAAGTYKIRIVRASGYTQTTPTNNFGNNATLTSGQKVTGKNFGADN